MVTEECQGCRFWKEVGPNEMWGECRRYAPRPAMSGQFEDNPAETAFQLVFWPTTECDWWCGEFQAAKVKPDPLAMTVLTGGEPVQTVDAPGDNPKIPAFLKR